MDTFKWSKAALFESKICSNLIVSAWLGDLWHIVQVYFDKVTFLSLMEIRHISKVCSGERFMLR
jgi:hypothetical protein